MIRSVSFVVVQVGEIGRTDIDPRYHELRFTVRDNTNVGLGGLSAPSCPPPTAAISFWVYGQG